MAQKISGLLLVGLLLFNSVGLYLVFLGLNYGANERMEQRLDNGLYKNCQTITIKVPLYLPYQSDWQHFHRVDGKLDFQGKHYNAVKHRIFRDTMYTVFVRNNYKNRLDEKMDQLVSLFSGFTGSGSGESHVRNNLLKDFLLMDDSTLYSHFSGSFLLDFAPFMFRLSSRSGQVLSPPPKKMT